MRSILLGLALLFGCASSHISSIAIEDRTGHMVLVVATDGASWYIGGDFVLHYKRIKKSDLTVTVDKTIPIEFAGGFRVSIGAGGSIHISGISKLEAIQMLKLYGLWTPEVAHDLGLT